MGISIQQRRGGSHSGDERDKLRRIERANELWDNSISVKGTVCDDYLYSRRHIDDLPRHSAVHFLPENASPAKWPAMLAALRDESDQLTAVQLTYLDPASQRKASTSIQRQTFGLMGNGAVKLARCDQGTLGLAEGVETALSAIELFDVPVWATLGAARFRSIAIPKEIRRVVLFADNDPTGIRCATAAYHHYRLRGLDVKIKRPRELKDFNDVLRQKKRNA